MLHQFPIGYLPVAAASASRQLPAPGEAVDPLAGRRFPPRDHPRADLIDDRDALARVRSGEVVNAEEEWDGVDRPVDFTAGHEPLAELSELEWERRYTGPAGHRWPASEAVPEGCVEPGEPVVLDSDTVLDALGSGTGRVAAPDGTAFIRRSLPPEYLELPYHRYRVLRPLPVWRAVSAPWFAANGGGVRYRLTHSLAELVALGHLAELTTARLAAEAGTLRLDRHIIDAAERHGETERAASEDDAPRRPERDQDAPVLAGRAGPGVAAESPADGATEHGKAGRPGERAGNEPGLTGQAGAGHAGLGPQRVRQGTERGTDRHEVTEEIVK